MCGICGAFAFPRSESTAPAVLDSMLATIDHRGPDAHGVHTDGPVSLGSARLSIIDLPGGNQPMTNEDGTIVLVFNGEIYNYRELAARLRANGHRLATESDTEVVVHLYEELGDELVHELRGMFAFALWDARRGRLLIARDRLGIKPLYYAETSAGLLFGSEIKAIAAHPSFVPRLAVDALSNFLALKYVPAPQTMFDGVAALPPGHLLTCDTDGVRTRRYWDVSYTGETAAPLAEEEYAQQLEDVLRDAVRSHLVSDVPFGAFLSGGVDSSTVVALMTQFLDTPVKTFAVGYEGEGASVSELPYARLVAQALGTDHQDVLIDANDLIQLSEKIVWHLDQPVADEACLANYVVARLARSRVKMVLTGEGGDELFAGYARYAGERLSPATRILPARARSLAPAIAARVPGLRRPKVAVYALAQPDELSRFVNWFPLFNSGARRRLLHRDVLELGAQTPEAVFAEALASTDARDPVNRLLYVDTKLWLPDDLLARGDKMSMAASLEARVPLLDHHVVEFAASLPPNLKLHRLTRKYLLKNVAAKWLPAEIITRKKQGFPVPTSAWFRGAARDFVHDHLSEATVRRRGLFDPEYVAQLLGEHDSGFADHGPQIWGLLSVELWQRLFVDAHRTSEVARAVPA